MNLTSVESSTLVTVGYDQNSKLFQLEFRSRAVYQYFAVPAAIHEALLAAASKGSYFNRAIRGRFDFVRVAGRKAAGGAADPVLSGNTREAAWPAR
jgi:hypothetical protein